MKKNGFTLLEMIIVVAVLSVLFLLTIPNIRHVMNIVETKGCEAQKKVIDSAILQFKLEYGQYPNSIQDLVDGEFITSEQAVCSDNTPIYIQDGHAHG